MRTHSRIQRLGNSRGQTLVEFSLTAVTLVMLLIGVVEIGRMVLVYTTMANAARAGARYAMVHGANSPATVSTIQTVVTNFLRAAPLTAANATIYVQYPDASPCDAAATATPGCHVRVAVTYPYDPLTAYFGIASVHLGSSSQGVIAF